MAMQEVKLSRQNIVEACRHDIDNLAAVLLPHICTVKFPLYYSYLFQLFTSTDNLASKKKLLRFALGLPRGHAKTTFVKLLICWCILYDAYMFILIVCANESLAQNALEDVETILSSSQVVETWGPWKGYLTRDTKTLKRGPHHGHDKIIAALGAQSSLRGINIANRRPDFIFADDVQTRESAMSITESSSLFTWFLGTLLKARDMQRCLVIYVGNMYNEDCILFQLKLHPAWESFITSAILPDLKPLWPELFSIADLLDEYEHDSAAGHPEIWFSEVMNIPQGGKNSLLVNGTIPESGIGDYDTPLAQFLTIDPAGLKESADDNVISRHAIYPELDYQVEDTIAGVMTPDEVITLALKEILDHNIKFVFVETVGYQQILKWYFEKTLAQYPNLADVRIEELKPGGRQKNHRIAMFFNSVNAAGYHVHARCKRRIILQALAFRIDRKDNRDDILDACAYGLDVKSKWQAEILALAAYEDNLAKTMGLHSTSTLAQAQGIIENNSFLD